MQLYSAIQPSPLVFSKNPIVFSWKILPNSAEVAELNYTLQVKVEIQVENQFAEKNLLLKPDPTGLFTVDIHRYIDSFLKFEFPLMDDLLPQEAIMQSCMFAVSVVLKNDYEKKASIPKKWYRAIKGGLAKQNNDIAAFLSNQILEKKSLIFSFPGQEIHFNDIHICSVLAVLPETASFHLSNAAAAMKFLIKYYDEYESESATIESLSIAVRYGKIVHCPIHISNNYPANFATAKKIEIKAILTFNTIEYVIASETYAINTFYKTAKTLLYANSLGGINTLSLINAEELNYNYQKNSFKQIDIDTYYKKNTIKEDYNTDKAIERGNIKLVTAALNRFELDRLRDLFLSPAVYFAAKKLIPVSTTNDIKLTETSGGLFQLNIDVNESIINNSYTAENAFAELGICPIPMYLILSQTEGATVDVDYKFPDNHYAGKLEITNTVESKTYTIEITQNEGKLSVSVYDLNIHNVAEFSIRVRLFTKCADSYSAYKESNIIIQKYAAPSLPTLFANTYEGGGYRILNFQHNSQNILKSFKLNNDPVEYNIILSTTNSGYSNTGNSAYFGSYFINELIAPATLIKPFVINYSPVSNFVGRDVITYYALARQRSNATNQSKYVAGKIYINVAGNNPANAITNQAVYVKHTALIADMIFDPQLMTYSTTAQLDFFEDPYGLKPLDVSGKGIIVYVQHYDAITQDLKETITVQASGSSCTFKQLFMKSYGPGNMVQFDVRIAESNQYYII